MDTNLGPEIQVLLICGGGGSEHDISLTSAQFFKDTLSSIAGVKVHYVEICRDGVRRDENGKSLELRKDGLLVRGDEVIRLNFAIPCFHGTPGETGEIQCVFEMMGLPYLGCGPEASMLSFNKVSTKLWMQALGIPNSPFIFVTSNEDDEIKRAQEFFAEHGDIFIKASNQGSSVGAYHVTEASKVESTIKDAFNYSSYVLIEKTMKGREVEMSVYQYKGELVATAPGEIICPGGFYDFNEKYSGTSKTKTLVRAPGLAPELVARMQEAGKRLFKGLKYKHLVRVDFFVIGDEFYINEPNTFPGHTKISLFPMMMKENGHSYRDFLEHIIKSEARK